VVGYNQSFAAMIDVLKHAVKALREAAIPFMLGGSLAAWARGGPYPRNDLDLMVKPADADAALAALAAIGMRPERPPEEWLYKAWRGDVMVDLIFAPSGLEITDEVIGRATALPVMAVSMPVMSIDDVLTSKLFALSEQALDYSSLVGIARALREQIDWSRLRAATESSPYARAFFTIVEGLGVAPGPHGEQDHERPRVRVLSGGGGAAAATGSPR
jgi:Uncharacterised nucleotidyltransferase